MRPALPFVAAAVFVASASVLVPVRNLALEPVLSGGERLKHWPIAVTGLLLVLAVVLPVGRAALRRRSRPGPPGASGHSGAFPIGVHAVSLRVVAAAAAVSAVVGFGILAQHRPAWIAALAAMGPWVPLLVAEEMWAWRAYGFFAVFLGLAVLQAGHLAEHATQVGQLLTFGGDLTRSHGVFGQLDFELVHFVWDTGVWVGGAILVLRLPASRWLWLSWVAASVHQVEHIYLFWSMRLDHEFWAHGGIAGIFGQGGLVGSPLARPYLHLAYNVVVVVPMLYGLWAHARDLRDGAVPASRCVGRRGGDRQPDPTHSPVRSPERRRLPPPASRERAGSAARRP